MFERDFERMRAEMDRIEQWWAQRAQTAGHKLTVAGLRLKNARKTPEHPARDICVALLFFLLCAVAGTWLVGGF